MSAMAVLANGLTLPRGPMDIIRRSLAAGYEQILAIQMNLPVNSAVHEPNRASVAQFVGYFLWLGTVGFGGPIALAGYMQQDLVEDRRWVRKEDYLEGL